MKAKAKREKRKGTRVQTGANLYWLIDQSGVARLFRSGILEKTDFLILSGDVIAETKRGYTLWVGGLCAGGIKIFLDRGLLRMTEVEE